jgi:hypothetical protein
MHQQRLRIAIPIETSGRIALPAAQQAVDRDFSRSARLDPKSSHAFTVSVEAITKIPVQLPAFAQIRWMG